MITCHFFFIVAYVGSMKFTSNSNATTTELKEDQERLNQAFMGFQHRNSPQARIHQNQASPL